MSTSEGAASPIEFDSALEAYRDWVADYNRARAASEEEPSRLEPGAMMGEFELLRRLQTGGMGVVYEGRQRSIAGRRVAVKVLRDVIPTPHLAERFQREIETIAVLDHPCIVPVVGAGIEDGVPYYAMQLVEGISAGQIVRTLRDSGEVPGSAAAVSEILSGSVADDSNGSSTGTASEASWTGSYFSWVARLSADLADTLQYAHDHGTIHRDVKPGNVMVRPSGRPVLLDFGLASSDAADSLTATGDFLGTLGYASPEQVRGEPATPASDVYALGATLYELLTLRRPVRSRSRAEILRDLELGEVPSLESWVPADLRTICLRAMARLPQQRYASARDMEWDLRAWLAGEPIRARPPGIAARSARWVRRHPRIASGIGAVVLIGLLAVGNAYRVAAGHVADGRAILDACLAEQRPAYVETLLALREVLERNPLEEGVFGRTDDLRAEERRLRTELEDGLNRAKQTVSRAFGSVSGHGGARRELARVAATWMDLALLGYEDVYGTSDYLGSRTALAHYDDAGAYAGLLDEGTYLELSSDPPGARARVFADAGAQGEVLREGLTPLVLEGLRPGSYVARLEHADGRRARYPFLLRCNSAYQRPGALPPQRLEVKLMHPDRVGPGFVYVPAGWSFVEDDPARVQYVEEFTIQVEETTYADWLAWMNWNVQAGRGARWGFDDPEDPEYRPRQDDGLIGRHVVWDGRRWVCAPGTDPEWPVRGLKWTEIDAYAGSLHELEPSEDGDWYDSLPRRAEWVRAARGADVRAFPWGDDFEWASLGAFVSGGDLQREASPYPTGSFPRDLSPFGVLDLAGSIAEVTLDPFGLLRDERTVCGGSYRSFDRRNLGVLGVRKAANVPASEIGFRLVRRPLPEHLRGSPVELASLEDDFERADGETLGNGWFATRGCRLPDVLEAPPPGTCGLRAGRLVCTGGEGNFSKATFAVHALQLPRDGWSVRADLSYDARSMNSATGHVTLRLVDGFGPSHGCQLGWTLGPRSSSLQVGRGVSISAPTEFEPRTPHRIELLLAAGHLEARIWRPGATRPVDPVQRVPFEASWSPSFLCIGATHLVGATVEIDEISVTPRGAEPPETAAVGQ